MKLDEALISGSRETQTLRFEAYLRFGSNQSYRFMIENKLVTPEIDKLIIKELRDLYEKNHFSEKKLKYINAPQEVKEMVGQKIMEVQKANQLFKSLNKDKNQKEKCFEILALLKKVSEKNKHLKFWEKNGKLPKYEPNDLSSVEDSKILDRIKKLKLYQTPSYIARNKLSEAVQKRHKDELVSLTKTIDTRHAVS